MQGTEKFLAHQFNGSVNCFDDKTHLALADTLSSVETFPLRPTVNLFRTGESYYLFDVYNHYWERVVVCKLLLI